MQNIHLGLQNAFLGLQNVPGSLPPVQTVAGERLNIGEYMNMNMQISIRLQIKLLSESAGGLG